MKHFSVLVPGSAGAADQLDITSPFDFSKIATADLADEQTIERALQTAAELYRDRKRWLPLSERLAILEKAATIMQDDFDQLAAAA